MSDHDADMMDEELTRRNDIDTALERKVEELDDEYGATLDAIKRAINKQKKLLSELVGDIDLNFSLWNNREDITDTEIAQLDCEVYDTAQILLEVLNNELGE